MALNLLQMKIGSTALTGGILAFLGAISLVGVALMVGYALVSAVGTVSEQGTILSCAEAEGGCQPTVGFRISSGQSITFDH